MPATLQASSPDPLAAFLEGLDPADAVRLRTLAHSWQGGGGELLVGRLAIRLLAQDGKGHAFTAGTLHRGREPGNGPTLELGRVLLNAHGVGAAAWTEWCDERPELRHHGFAADAKFPSVRLAGLPDPALARLALGLRDLARACVHPKAS